MAEKPWEASPLERKVITYSCIALAGATIGFLGGVSYGQGLLEPISIMEQKLNDDQYPDLSIIDKELNRIEYVGSAGGSYTDANPDKSITCVIHSSD